MSTKLTGSKHQPEIDTQDWMERYLRYFRVGKRIKVDYMGMPDQLELLCVARKERPLELTIRPVLFGVLLKEVKAKYANKEWTTS